MSKKVAFNGLDNAEIEFSKVSIPFSNMLSGVAGLNDDGSYSLKVENHLFVCSVSFTFFGRIQRSLFLLFTSPNVFFLAGSV